MLTLRLSSARGRTQIGWLDSHHTFSFGEYQDSAFMGFRSLRVLNDDIVAPGQGFGTHGHRDMEIISLVLEGALEHRDSLGHGAVLRPGEVQVMSAGSGIRHSEFNGVKDAPTHFLQMWILPERQAITPNYGQKDFPESARLNRFIRVAGRDDLSRDGALPIAQDADLFVTTLEGGRTADCTLRPTRAAWVHVATGHVLVNGIALHAGDGAAITDEARIQVTGVAPKSELVVFDLA